MLSNFKLKLIFSTWIFSTVFVKDNTNYGVKRKVSIESVRRYTKLFYDLRSQYVGFVLSLESIHKLSKLIFCHYKTHCRNIFMLMHFSSGLEAYHGLTKFHSHTTVHKWKRDEMVCRMGNNFTEKVTRKNKNFFNRGNTLLFFLTAQVHKHILTPFWYQKTTWHIKSPNRVLII